MFGFFKKKPPLNKIETLIGSNTSFNGHLKCDGNVRIDGLCEGGIIETVGNVVVAPEGRVAATIIAEHVSVAGEVTGAIQARGRLEILSTGRVMGNVQVANFYKDEAGVLGGRLIMGQEQLQNQPNDTVKKEETEAVTEIAPQQTSSITTIIDEKDEPETPPNDAKSADADASNADASKIS